MTTTFERRQTILRFLQEEPGLKVTNLADYLNVSEGTIRNDLDALEQTQKVRRVRGGAVLIDHKLTSPQQNQAIDPENESKKRMGQRAVELISDGDAIFLDDSTTVQAMIPFLHDFNRLTILTNGLETARLLAGSTNTIILIGGVVGSTGRSTSTVMALPMLENLHMQTAFVSANGFSFQTGLTERHIEEARLKSAILSRTEGVVALVTSSRLGKVSTTPFAPLARLSHFLTDADVEDEFVRQMRAAGVNLIICGQNTVRTYMVKGELPKYTIGFANQSERLPFAIDVRRGLERAVQARHNIDLVVTDNKLSGEEALRAADSLLKRHVDLVIEYQIDYKTGSQLMNKFQQSGVPVIAVDIPMVGANFFGVDNYQAGCLAGKALGEWVVENWQGQLDWLFVLVEPRAGSLPEARIFGQLDQFQTVVGTVPDEKVVTIDSGNTTAVSAANVRQALLKLPKGDRVAVISFNDEAALGALQAARALDREPDVVIVGQGGDRLIRDEVHNPCSRLIGTTAYRPEAYGEKLLDLAVKILEGESVPPAVYIQHVFLDAQNIDLYYPPDDS